MKITYKSFLNAINFRPQLDNSKSNPIFNEVIGKHFYTIYYHNLEEIFRVVTSYCDYRGKTTWYFDTLFEAYKKLKELAETERLKETNLK
jgi:hypothetical protein